MKKMNTTVMTRNGVLVLFLLMSWIMAYSQAVPEYMYYKFDAPGDQQNFASAPVGTLPAVLTGLTIGPTGEFGTALIGNGLTSGSNRLNTGWATNLPSSGWTISFWLNNFPATASTTFYFFGDGTAQSFRCFTGGVAGNGNLLVRGTGITDVPINGISPGPIVLHIVYTGSAIKIYKNGVFSNEVPQGSVNFNGAGPFLVGGYTTSNSFTAGTMMDEFRLYNRALTDTEITITWNQPLPLVTGPVVVTTAATSVTSTTATLNGTVNANTASTTVTFEYGLTTAYGTVVAGVPGTVTGNTVTPVNAPITGLLPNTTYNYRIVGVNANGAANGNNMTFTTGFAPPAVVTTAATALLLNGATLNGTVNANGASSAVSFEYGLTTAYGSVAVAVPATVTGTAVTPVSAVIAGLLPFTTYNCRVVGVNSGGATNGNNMTFTTAGPPTVVTNPVTNVLPVSATLNGTITANNLSTTVSFEWGLTTAYGNTATATPGTVTGVTATPVSANIAGLTNGVTYNYRCKGVNTGGTTFGANMSFIAGCPAVASAGAITGPTGVCSGSTGKVYSIAAIPNATGYTWTVPAGAVITAGANTTTITVTFGATSGNVSVFGTSSCMNGATANVAVTVNPLPVPTITGPSPACLGTTTNVYTTQTGMTGYTWTVSSGGTITAGATTNSITVTWNATGAQTVSVNYSNANGCSAVAPVSFPVTVNTLPTPSITGTGTVCQGTSGSVYTTQPGMTNYVWTVSPGGTITAGGGTTNNTVTVTWTTGGAKTVTVNYNNASGCAAATPASFSVTVNPTPVPVIGSSNNPCVGSPNNIYYTETGMTGYVWTVSSGGTIVSGQGTATLNATWNVLGMQTVSVTYTSTAGCAAATPTVYYQFVNSPPGPAGAITGTASVCAGASGVTYSTTPVVGITSYSWTVPSGATIASGAGTTSIVVDFGTSAVPGNITVAATNQCGNGPASSFPVSVSPLPATAGTITGPATVCAGQTGVAYSVPTITNATSYVWTLPAGATITSGSGTKNIVVTFGATAGAGVITVKGTNTCGSGTSSPNFSVTINAIPPAPVVTEVGNVLTSSAATGNQWYYEGAAIAGATGQSYTVTTNTGYYWCVVTVNGCSSPASNMVWVVITGQQELQSSLFNIYPVPNDGRFTVSINSPAQETFSIVVYNQLGVKVHELTDVKVNGTFEKQIDLGPVATGIYSVVFLGSDNRVVRKVMVNKQ
ncbi:MAG: LamG-like jellyroll fold domain-containing protein [Bacteroidales bacterium]|nr:LamG-like jellyroll fold domain-containing protein [Bacteroidales bacterium]